jgi:type II secretory pathway component PulF
MQKKYNEKSKVKKCLTFPFLIFVVAGCIVYMLAVVVSLIVVFCVLCSCFVYV